MPENTFEQLGVSPELVNTLADMGIDEPFEIQKLALQDALQGRDVLARAPTGSGKTLAFSIPIVERTYDGDPTPAALVLVPTRELAAQVADVCTQLANTYDLGVGAAYGGVRIATQAKRVDGAHILVATPGRLLDLIEQRMVDVSGIHMLVLDEADRMLDMGFLPQVDRIVKRTPRNRQTMFFSATLDGEVGRIAQSYTVDPQQFSVHDRVEVHAQVEHRFVQVTPATKVDTLVDMLGDERELVLIFARTKRGVVRLARQLRNHGMRVAAMHGDMAQAERERTLARFERGDVRTLIATDVAARGLDLDDITHVVNFDPPQDSKEYVHRVGRTGRAGRTGIGITLVLAEQRGDVSAIARRLNLTESFERSGMTLAPPRLAYATKARRGSRLGPRRR